MKSLKVASSLNKQWDIVEGGIYNKDWGDLDDLEDAITERIKPY